MRLQVPQFMYEAGYAAHGIIGQFLSTCVFLIPTTHMSRHYEYWFGLLIHFVYYMMRLLSFVYDIWFFVCCVVNV